MFTSPFELPDARSSSLGVQLNWSSPVWKIGHVSYWYQGGSWWRYRDLNPGHADYDSVSSRFLIYVHNIPRLSSGAYTLTKNPFLYTKNCCLYLSIGIYASLVKIVPHESPKEAGI